MDIDWKQACINIVQAVSAAEGVYFEEGWNLPEPVVKEIIRLVEKKEKPPYKYIVAVVGDRDYHEKILPQLSYEQPLVYRIRGVLGKAIISDETIVHFIPPDINQIRGIDATDWIISDNIPQGIKEYTETLKVRSRRKK